ncbi:FAD-containing monooxygenase [Purpureocillium lavendulum]|uniref:FAD-containing monooxygenase n=1 Tax=Purpureocillium lavendulum TaxID=1247861 RepID=A0AB34G3W6_9HYPO|nr:FAD-containing monooxygenase [Purpureocillium lavendulum]
MKSELAAVLYGIAAAAIAAPHPAGSGGGAGALLDDASQAATAAWTDNFTVVPVGWEVQAFPGGEPVKLEGTVQEVRRQLGAMNPNYEIDFAHMLADGHDHDHDAMMASAAAMGAPQLGRRTNFDDAAAVCSSGISPFPPFGHIKSISFNEAAAYLLRHGGQPSLPAGPRVCGRVSCSYGGAVYVCNDTPAVKTLLSWRSVRDGLMAIIDKCGTIFPDYVLGGQIFHYTDWNVIYRSEDC